jgi:NAD-dependent deacetylase
MGAALERAIRDLALEMAPQPRLAVLTGAGISAESGLRTYRGPDGLYTDADVQQLVMVESLRTRWDDVIAHFQAWRERAMSVQPNAAHHALAELEKALGDRMTLITQNVDTLHERAGSRQVLAMHGDLATVRCEGRRGHVGPWEAPLTPHSRCEAVSWTGKRCGDPLRPHVVLFGENVMHPTDVDRAISRCTAFWAIGTSGTVVPAAHLVLQAKMAGATTALFNLTPPGSEADGPGAHVAARAFDHVILGKASETVPAAVEVLLAELGP